MADLDDNLVEAARTGSAEAFSRLVERHQQALRAFLRRACGNWALADDLAQETFITAWGRIERLGPGANVRAWLCGIGYNKALTALRADRRARRRDDAWREAAETPVAPAPEDRMALERAMAELPLEQRACVALCLAGDFSHAEAAQALDLPLGTVKSHVTRGRARLLAALNIEDEEPVDASAR
ncbi:RNA polymerase sigma factor [Phenylobacterium aquaticum]|uniref:RNA polymerase sigma factor n=1 Tax=Phenylobacterium aquaticum TaxID=1763816 RepID=UPI001F5D47C5|nr:RNA polymerase sigma factor [Phenylobacterium aquaticum]MCI3133867.1 RNA polymerase sigma factor [Phenylobacterium aquaticum]